MQTYRQSKFFVQGFANISQVIKFYIHVNKFYTVITRNYLIINDLNCFRNLIFFKNMNERFLNLNPKNDKYFFPVHIQGEQIKFAEL